MMDRYHSALIDLRDLLASVEDKYWRDAVAEFLQEFERLESSHAEPSNFAEHYRKVSGQIAGGMGSLTDLTLCSENGHIGDEDSLRTANRKMDELLNILYEEAIARIKAMK